jgi:hypothetical protein
MIRELEEDQAEAERLLKEIDKEPTWKEMLPYGVGYVVLVLALAFATRFLPEDVRGQWWVDPELVIGVFALDAQGYSAFRLQYRRV